MVLLQYFFFVFVKATNTKWTKDALQLRSTIGTFRHQPLNLLQNNVYSSLLWLALNESVAAHFLALCGWSEGRTGAPPHTTKHYLPISWVLPWGLEPRRFRGSTGDVRLLRLALASQYDSFFIFSSPNQSRVSTLIYFYVMTKTAFVLTS